MKALHRLAGNFPKRGYGLALRSEGFPLDTAVFPQEGARMPGHTMAMPYGRKPVDASTLVDMFHVFEIQPLDYGKLASIHIANCAMKGIRPSGYVDAVVPDAVGENGLTSKTVGLEAMLRFDGFTSSRTFWDMPEGENAIAPTPWEEDATMSLAWQMPDFMGEKEQRALVATVWRTATYRRFGPWVENNRQKCLYEDDRLMWHIPRMDRSVYVCLGSETNDDKIIRQAKAFVYSAVYSKLPRQMSNIASVSAPVSMATIPGFFYDSALCVVYPEENISVGLDLRTGKCLQVPDEVHAMVDAVMRGETDPIMAQMLADYARITGCQDVDDASFSADYDVYMSLYRLQHTEDVGQLLREWYALNAHMNLRHGLTTDVVTQVLASADRYVLEKLHRQLPAVEKWLCEREDDARVKDALGLRRFLWGKALLVADDLYAPLRDIVLRVEKLDAPTMFTDFLVGCGVANATQDARAAELLESLLMGQALNGKLNSKQVEDMCGAAGFIQKNPALTQAMTRFLAEDHRQNVQRRPHMTKLTSRFLKSEDVLLAELRHMKDMAPQTLPDEPQCRMVQEYWCLAQDHTEAASALVDFFVTAFTHHQDKMVPLYQIAGVIGADMTDSLCGILTCAISNRLYLETAQLQPFFGTQKRTGMLAMCKNQGKVMDTWLNYVQLVEFAGGEQRDLYPWLMSAMNAARNASGLAPELKSRLVAECDKISVQTTLRRSGSGAHVPTGEAFESLVTMAQQGSGVFHANEEAVETMFENLMAGEHREATQPYASAILPCFASTDAFPNLHELALQTVRQKLWDVWATGGYWQGVDAIQGDVMQMALNEQEVLNPQTKMRGDECLARNFAGLKAPREYASRFKHDDKRQTVFRAGWYSRLCESAVNRYDQMFMSCETVQDARALQEMAKLLQVADRTMMTKTGYAAHCLFIVVKELNAMLANGASFSAAEETFKKMYAGTIASAKLKLSPAAPRVMDLIRTEYCSVQREALNGASFMVRLAIVLLCAWDMREERMDWQLVMDVLCPGNADMMRKPFSAASLPLLQTVTALLREMSDLYQLARLPESWTDSLYRFLQEAPAWKAYTDEVKDDRKQLEMYLPNCKDEPVLARWLKKQL